MKTGNEKSKDVDPTAAAAPKRILVPLDFSACSLEALRHALTLARLSQSEIVLVHAVEPMQPGWMMESPRPRELHGRAVQHAEQSLADLARRLIPQQARVRHFVRTGKPFRVITRLAQRIASDLIVLGTHGQTNLKSALLGSTAERVARHAHCPVLIVREKPAKGRSPRVPSVFPALP